MSRPVRKLTIRLPDGRRFRRAVIGEIHASVGARVAAGDAVMTLNVGRRNHLVRTPKPGRAVPLAAVGDRVDPGDALFVLNLDAEAIAEIERDRTALVTLPDLERTNTAEDVVTTAVRTRGRSRFADLWALWSGTVSGVEPWGRPVLSVALYGLACLAAFPMLSRLAAQSDLAGLLALGALAVCSGLLVYATLAPRRWLWPRRVVGLVATSWVAMGVVALLLPFWSGPNTDPPAELTLAAVEKDPVVEGEQSGLPARIFPHVVATPPVPGGTGVVLRELAFLPPMRLVGEAAVPVPPLPLPSVAGPETTAQQTSRSGPLRPGVFVLQPRPRIPVPDDTVREPDPVTLGMAPAVLAAVLPAVPPKVTPRAEEDAPVPVMLAMLDLPPAGPEAPPGVPPPSPELAERRLLFLYVDDPRLAVQPGPGDSWLPALPKRLRSAVASSTVMAVEHILQVDRWCPAARGGTGRTASLSDGIRLLEVRLLLEREALPALEQAIPVFGGGPHGFFHNRHPLLGGRADEPLLPRARAYLTGLGGGGMDPNHPPLELGGRYYDDPTRAAADLIRFGCRGVIWNGGEGPDSPVARAVTARARQLEIVLRQKSS